MKLSQLSAEFDKLGSRVDQLVQGVVSGEFDQRVDQLEAQLRELKAWTKPRGKGTFEVDIEPYRSSGGAPAFMRRHAGLLLGAATVLRNARKVRFVISKRFGAIDRSDLRVPLTAPLNYTGEEIKKIQRLFKYLYSHRAYRKLNSGEIFIRSMAEGYFPDNVRNIQQLSRYNLRNLRRDLAPLSDREKVLYSTFHRLPFYLKHATTAASWTTIYNSRLIFSKDSLKDWNIGVATNTPWSDETYKQDVDFAFFRVEIGKADIRTRYGQDDDQRRIVFEWDQLLEDGWVSLHDMLAPLGMDIPGSGLELRTHDSGELVRISVPDMALEKDGGREQWIHWKWKHCYPGLAYERKVHILDEVFYGPDILEGMCLSLLRDLREIPALQQEAYSHYTEQEYWFWLLKSLFRVEAKYPSAFRFEQNESKQDVVSIYPEDNPALRPTTGHTASATV